MSKELKKGMATTYPTEGEWFTRFISGIKACLGRQLDQDLGILIDVMLKIQELLEEEWEETESWEDRKRVAECAFVFYGTFCWCLRGEELLLISTKVC